MADGRSGTSGRGGRGASLLEMMKMRKPGASDPTPGPSPPHTVSAPSTSSAVSAGRGRAGLLEMYKRQSDSSLQPSSAPSVSTGVSRGRASLLSLTKITVTPGQAIEPPSTPGPSGDAGVQEQLASLSLADTGSTPDSEPISRQGESGQPIQLTANYIHLKIEPGKGVFEYEVKYSPDIDSRALRFKLLNQHLVALGGTKTFDGTVLYLPQKLSQEKVVFQSDHPMDGSTVNLHVIFKRQRRLSEVIHLFNVLLRRIMGALKLVQIGRQNFNPRAAHSVPHHRLELWPGYVSAIDEYEGGLQLCLDSTHRVLRTETVHDFLRDIYQRDSRNFRESVMKEIVGTSVLTRYNNKVYRVDDIIWDSNPLMKFDMKGAETTLVDYYKTHWNIQIKDLKQPLLLHRAKIKTQTGETQEQVISLIPELCYLSGLTDGMRADFKVMKDLATVTRVAPDHRRDVIRRFIKEVKSNEVARKLLADWGLCMEDDTVPLSGRVLNPETIYFGNGKIHKGQTNADWSGPTTRLPMLSTPNLKFWFIIVCQRDAKSAEDFSNMMRKVAPVMGMDISAPKAIVLRDDRTESFLNALRTNISQQVELMVIICPTNRNDRYAAIKKVCCVEMPIASQVIMGRTISRSDKLKSITQKIALQINCKLGGTLWAVEIPFDNCMVCGVDVHHAGAGQSARGSVAGFVASLDKPLTRWYSKICLQGPHQELIDGLKVCLVSALRAYNKVNNRYPDRIIMYRDGVGDGQLEVVSKYETKQLEMSFSLIDQSYNPKMSVIIVQKRINTRVFAKSGNRLDNPPPGTVVDHSITRRNWYDFFLVSQNVRQGTVSPTHYIVVHDSAKMRTDHLQRLTFKLCHLYYNWPGTVRVPAPCQYAHKLAFLVGQSIQMEPHESLANKLYFL